MGLYRNKIGSHEIVNEPLNFQDNKVKFICFPGLLPIEQSFQSESEMPAVFLNSMNEVRKISGEVNVAPVDMYFEGKKDSQIDNFFARMSIHLGRDKMSSLLEISKTEQFMFCFDDVASSIENFYKYKEAPDTFASESAMKVCEQIFTNAIYNFDSNNTRLVKPFSEVEENLKKIRLYGISLGTQFIMELENGLNSTLATAGFKDVDLRKLLSNVFALGVSNIAPDLSEKAKGIDRGKKKLGFTKIYFENCGDVHFSVRNNTEPYIADFEGDYKKSKINANTDYYLVKTNPDIVYEQYPSNNSLDIRSIRDNTRHRSTIFTSFNFLNDHVSTQVTSLYVDALRAANFKSGKIDLLTLGNREKSCGFIR